MKLNTSLEWLWLLFGNNKPLEKALLLHKRGLITELVVGLQHKKSTFGLSFQEKKLWPIEANVWLHNNLFCTYKGSVQVQYM